MRDKIDLEWVALIIAAKKEGLSIQELRDIFQGNHEFFIELKGENNTNLSL